MSARREARLEALLVDHGGVLTTPITTSFAAFCIATGVGPDRLRDVLAAAYAVDPTGRQDGASPDGPGSLVAALELGRIDVVEFDRMLAHWLSQGLPEPLEPEDLSARMFAGLRPDDRMRGAVAEARRRGFRTAMVSNTWGLRPMEDGLGELFDGVILSGVEGVRKPFPEIFLLAATRLGVAPEACVFVDDIRANVEGARAVGMAAVLHRDVAITLPRLEKLLGVRLSRP